jgi:hypothetical protein
MRGMPHESDRVGSFNGARVSEDLHLALVISYGKEPVPVMLAVGLID